MPTTTAATAGKPSATISGAATAAGVPKPEAPSMKQPNSQVTMIACTRRSGLMPEKPLRMARMPPECLSVLSSRIAPKMIHRIEAVSTNPWRLEATTRTHVISQASRAMATVTAKTTGIAYFAGQRNPTSRTPARTRGKNASRDKSVWLIWNFPCFFYEECAQVQHSSVGLDIAITDRTGPDVISMV